MEKVTFIAPDNFGWEIQHVIDLFADAGKQVMPEQIIELGMQIKDDKAYQVAYGADIDGPSIPDNWDDIDGDTDEGREAYDEVEQQRDDLADAVKDSIKDVVGRFLELDVVDEKYEDVLEYLAYNFSPRIEDVQYNTVPPQS